VCTQAVYTAKYAGPYTAMHTILYTCTRPVHGCYAAVYVP